LVKVKAALANPVRWYPTDFWEATFSHYILYMIAYTVEWFSCNNICQPDALQCCDTSGHNAFPTRFLSWKYLLIKEINR
jgi:hypothetical protein